MHQLFCTACGAPRTLHTSAAYRSDLPGPLTCLRCGHQTFTTDSASAPRRRADWRPTRSDRRFLAALRIASDAGHATAADDTRRTED